MFWKKTFISDNSHNKFKTSILYVKQNTIFELRWVKLINNYYINRFDYQIVFYVSKY